MKYEYLKILTQRDEDWGQVNQVGKEGWELVSVRDCIGTVFFYFKRPLK